MRNSSTNIYSEKNIKMKNQQMKYNGYEIGFVNNSKYILKLNGVLVDGFFNSFESAKIYIDKKNEINRKNKNG